MEAQQVVETPKIEIPSQFSEYITSKTKKDVQGGRPHFLNVLAERGDVEEQIFDILEQVWMKDKPIGQIAKKFNVEYTTVYRLLKDLEPSKATLIAYLELAPRRKIWYNRQTDSSDYETVQAYIRRAKRSGLKRYRIQLRYAELAWRHFNYRDPERWTADEVCSYLSTLSEASQFSVLVSIRQVAPQIREKSSGQYVGTGLAKEKQGRRKKDLFGPEVKMIFVCLKQAKMPYHATVMMLHVATGAREGSVDTKSGICGLTWDRFGDNFARVDLYESKVKGGIWWRNCPTGLLFPDLPMQLKAVWEKRGKPLNDKLILGGYKELKQIYVEIRQALNAFYAGKVDPNLLQELTTINPHDADKLHCNLLWEADVKLEILAGQYLGRGEGIGLVGRGWLDLNTIKNHYLSLTQRSKKFQETILSITKYASETFKGD